MTQKVLPSTLFGTDGVRGAFGIEPMTLECLKAIGWSFGQLIYAHLTPHQTPITPHSAHNTELVSPTPPIKQSRNVTLSFNETRCGDGHNPMHNNTTPHVMIGDDGRFSAPAIRQSFCEGLWQAFKEKHDGPCLQTLYTEFSSQVCYIGVVSTPILSQWAQDKSAWGVMISASHNPYTDNGLKIFTPKGEKIHQAYKHIIEQYYGRYLYRHRYHPQNADHSYEAYQKIDNLHPTSNIHRARDEAILGGLIKRTLDWIHSTPHLHHAIAYEARHQIEQTSSCDASSCQKTYNVVFDGAHGGGAVWGQRLLEALATHIEGLINVPISIHGIHIRANGRNINHECGAVHPHTLHEAVRCYKAIIGFAIDGDGDRLIMSDGDHIYDGQTILGLLAMLSNNIAPSSHAPKNDDNGNIAPTAHDAERKIQKGLVGTLMTNRGFVEWLYNHCIPYAESAVGDEHVRALMHKNAWSLGGEPSGHVIILPENPHGCALQTMGFLLMFMVLHAQTHGGNLKRLLPLFTPWHQYHGTISKADVTPTIAEIHTYTHAAMTKDKNLRIVARFSGTEPILRLMTEHPDLNIAQKALEDLRCFCLQK